MKKIAWVPLLFFIGLAAGIFAWGVRGYLYHPKLKTGTAAHKQGNPSIKPEEISPGWWESRQSIYYGIPARVLVYLPGASPREARSLTGKAWMEFFRIGDIFNPFDPNSELAKLNASHGTGSMAVSNDLYALLSLSALLWRESGGLFDPTTMPVNLLWREAEKEQQPPSENQIKSVLQNTGFPHVRLAGGKLDLDNSHIEFDFGGIAKGYAVDRVRELVVKHGAAAGIIQLGGEVAAFGDNEGKPWRIGIQHPLKPEGIYGVVSHQGTLRVSTSGNYQQPIIIRGYSFYHIFSPKTGKPVPEKILGVTTLSTNPTISNALLDGAATAITVAGRTNGLALAEKLGIEALILIKGRDGAIAQAMTPGFSKFYNRPNKTSAGM